MRKVPGEDNESIDAVLPVAPRDIERIQILAFTLKRFFRPLGRLFVVVPTAHVGTVARALNWDRVCVRSESELLPELATYRRLFKASIVLRKRPDGWYIQQLVKLAAPAVVRTDFYLTLDADVVCLGPVDHRDLVSDGRAVCMRGTTGHHADWYEWSARALALPKARWSHGATPLLYSREAMQRMHRFLEGRANGVFRLMGSATGWRSLDSWVSVLLRNLPWAEHALYHTFLEHLDLYDHYHRDCTRLLHGAGSLWLPEHLESWDPATLIDPTRPFFGVIQSWLGLPAREVWRRVAPVLGGDPSWPPHESVV
jgi:hypothetical protein